MELGDEIEPLGVALGVDVILDDQVILVLLFLHQGVFTFMAINKLLDS